MAVRARREDILAYAAKRGITPTPTGIARAAGLTRTTVYRLLRGDAVSARSAEAIIFALADPGAEDDVRIAIFYLDRDQAAPA